MEIKDIFLAAFLIVGGYLGFLKVRKLLKDGLPTPGASNAEGFAKLLAAEIKLYNENKISRGLANNDLYDALRDEIEGARKTFTRSISDPAQMRHFDDAIVEVLAGGDRNKMGEIK